MEFSNCVDEWSIDEAVVKLQHQLDALTAFAHFFVPLWLIYNIRKYQIFPHKLVLIYFGTFTFLCGLRYATDTWRYTQYSDTSALVIKIVQYCTAAASWITVVITYFVFPKVLRIRENELILKNRIDDLSREKGFMLRELATTSSILRLIDEIRSTSDGLSIFKSTVVGLGQIFDLEDCSLWFPSHTNKTLRLFHSLNHLISVGSAVPMSLPVVAEIFNSVEAVRIPNTCPLVSAIKCTKRAMNSEAVAIRIPLPFTESDDSLNTCVRSYAVMVLVVPSDNIRKFRDYELELLGAVAEEVSVEVDHVAAIKESIMDCDHLKKNNSSEEMAIWNIAVALRDFNDSKTASFHQMETPVNALTILSSFLLETTLTPQQRAMVEMILRSSRSVETLLQNESELSELQDGIIEINLRVFSLSGVIYQVVNMIKPAAALKNLSLSLTLAPDLPVNAVGDQEKLMQVILIVIGNAVKFTMEGQISIIVSVAKPKTYRAWQPFKFHLVPSDAHFYLTMQIEDSGCGIDPQDIPNLFHPPSTSSQQPSAPIGLAICKRLLEVMDGDIWVESDGLGKGCTATFIVKLGTANTK